MRGRHAREPFRSIIPNGCRSVTRRQRRPPMADAAALPARARHTVVRVSRGTSCSSCVSEPCMPIKADSCGSARDATTAAWP